MAAKTKLFKLVATWLAEVRRESDPAATLAQYGYVQPVALTFDDVREAAVDAAMGRQGYDVLGAYVPVDNLVYVNATSGLDANPGTQALPVQTIDRGLELLARGWTRFGVLFLSADTYTVNANDTFVMPRAWGRGAYPLQIIGTWVDSGQGTLVVSGIAGGATSPPASWSVTLTGGTSGAWVADQWRGYALRKIAGGTVNGRQFQAFANGANTISGNFAAAGPFAANDQLVLEKPGTVLAFAGSATFFSAEPLVMRGCEVRIAASSLWRFNGRLSIVSGWLTNGGAGSPSLSFFLGGYFYTGNNATLGLPTKTDASIPSQLYANGDDTGIFVSSMSINLTFVHANLRNTVFAGTRPITVTSTSSYIEVNCQHLDATSIITTPGAASVTLNTVRFDAVTPNSATGAAVAAVEGSTLSLTNVVIANTPATTAPGDAILVQDRGFAILTGVTGTGNAGVGLRVQQLSRVKSVSPNVGVTVTGAGGDVVVGANAVTTWAVIAVPAAITNNDLGAAIPQLCRVSA